MTHLDRHVNTVRNKMALGVFLRALAWTLLAFAAVVWINILVDRFLQHRLPHTMIWFWAGLGVSIIGAAVLTLVRQPTRRQAAIAIDEKLGLKEKFSTALFIRSTRDPFAAAAVRDAEMTADNVSIQRRFPVEWPKMLVATVAMALVASITSFMDPHPLFGQDLASKKQAQLQQEKAQQDARHDIQKAISEIDQAPKSVAERETIQAAKRDLTALLNKPIKEPAAAQLTARQAMQEMDSIKQKIKDAQRYADAQNEMKIFKSLSKPMDENSPVGKVQQSIEKAQFSEAVKQLDDVVKKFDQMKKPDQEKAAQQMSQMAQQLQQIANSPQQQQQIQKQLQQMGASQQQLQQLAQAVQQAAGGDKQAQQQVQQMANQIAQQLNQQAGLTQRQQQQISQQVQQAVKQMQGNANAQQTAQQMAAAAKQMAQAMQQQAQQGGQQGQQGKPGQQQGNQQGMANAQKQMQQQLQQMQQAADDSAEIAAGQQADNQNDGTGDQGDKSGRGDQASKAGGQGKFAQGDPNKNRGNGSGGPGVSDGGPRPPPAEAPFAVKPEKAPSQTIDKGKILASTFVKAMSEKGASKVTLSQVVEAQEKESTDEVEQDRISRPAQNVVKKYFDDLKKGQEEVEPAGK